MADGALHLISPTVPPGVVAIGYPDRPADLVLYLPRVGVVTLRELEAAPYGLAWRYHGA